ncbi:hypothetical protein ILUMI_07033 [Ignelater luminosus]|uniref:Protein sleepless n=1 Tax=Ignelater luminosus TaxID=2038154 RepID=A0A8K0D4M0_IGNLU|nr:hypothetical protein ILUMI_07033 [Ignelater luminosus]
MAKFVCLLLVLAVLANTGLALKCYQCKSDKADGCLKGGPNTKEQNCGNPATGFKSVCYYKEFHDSNKKTVEVNSSCGVMAANAALDGLSECTPLPGFTKKECRVCETDLCNSASALSTSFFVILCLPVMYFVSKLF